MSTVHPKGEKLIYHCTKSDSCKKTFSQQFRLRLHEKSHISYSKREYICDRCSDVSSATVKRFSTLSQLKSHKKSVHGDEDIRQQESNENDLESGFQALHRYI